MQFVNYDVKRTCPATRGSKGCLNKEPTTVYTVCAAQTQKDVADADCSAAQMQIK